MNLAKSWPVAGKVLVKISTTNAVSGPVSAGFGMMNTGKRAPVMIPERKTLYRTREKMPPKIGTSRIWNQDVVSRESSSSETFGILCWMLTNPPMIPQRKPAQVIMKRWL